MGATGRADATVEFVNHWVTRDTEAFDLLASQTRYILRLDDHRSYRTLDETWLTRSLEILVPASPGWGWRWPLQKRPKPPSGVTVQLFPGVFRRMGR